MDLFEGNFSDDLQIRNKTNTFIRRPEASSILSSSTILISSPRALVGEAISEAIFRGVMEMGLVS